MPLVFAPRNSKPRQINRLHLSHNPLAFFALATSHQTESCGVNKLR